jgi:F-type H+-transporting ATPase subunit b
MLIDWFTVAAQAVNFLVLVWLMKRFLYQPILQALDAREKRIAAELEDADAKKAEALTEREEFRRKNDAFDRQHAALLGKAADEAASERQRLLDAARKDADSMRSKLQDALLGEYQHLNEEIARRTRTEVLAIAQKALTDLAGTGLEARMVEVFVRQLRDLSRAEKERLAALPTSPEVPVLVRSAFDLAAPQRTLIEAAVREALSGGMQISFEVVPDLVCGIELIMGGEKIAWSISDYLAALGKGVNDLLKAQHITGSDAAPQ